MGPRRGSSTIPRPEAGLGGGTSEAARDLGLTPTPDELLGFAQALFAMREGQRAFLNFNRIGEPGWDMLLALVIASLEQGQLTATDVARASGLPASTALRWMDALQEGGFIRHLRDAHDACDTFVELEPEARAKMVALLGCDWQRLRAGWSQ